MCIEESQRSHCRLFGHRGTPVAWDADVPMPATLKTQDGMAFDVNNHEHIDQTPDN